MQHCEFKREVALHAQDQHCTSMIDTLLQEYDEWNDSSHLEVLVTISKPPAVESPLSWPLMCHNISSIRKKRKKGLKEDEEEEETEEEEKENKKGLSQLTFRCSMAFCSS